MLLVKINSTVPTYSDEFVFAKSDLIFRGLPACRQVCLHAEGCPKDSLIIDYNFYYLLKKLSLAELILGLNLLEKRSSELLSWLADALLLGADAPVFEKRAKRSCSG